jgi:hypothetical protein
MGVRDCMRSLRVELTRIARLHFVHGVNNKPFGILFANRFSCLDEVDVGRVQVQYISYLLSSTAHSLITVLVKKYLFPPTFESFHFVCSLVCWARPQRHTALRHRHAG